MQKQPGGCRGWRSDSDRIPCDALVAEKSRARPVSVTRDTQLSVITYFSLDYSVVITKDIEVNLSYDGLNMFFMFTKADNNHISPCLPW